MSKYDRLGPYLREQATDIFPMTFAEIERVVGSKLPKSQEYPAWWSNSTTNNVMTQIWLDAGYRTEQVDTVRKRLVFKRVASGNKTTGMTEEAREFEPDQTKGEKKPRRSPLFGALKGTFTIAPGYDLTSPVYSPEEWEEIEGEVVAKFDRPNK